MGYRVSIRAPSGEDATVGIWCGAAMMTVSIRAPSGEDATRNPGIWKPTRSRFNPRALG